MFSDRMSSTCQLHWGGALTPEPPDTADQEYVYDLSGANHPHITSIRVSFWRARPQRKQRKQSKTHTLQRIRDSSHAPYVSVGLVLTSHWACNVLSYTWWKMDLRRSLFSYSFTHTLSYTHMHTHIPQFPWTDMTLSSTDFWIIGIENRFQGFNGRITCSLLLL